MKNIRFFLVNIFLSTLFMSTTCEDDSIDSFDWITIVNLTNDTIHCCQDRGGFFVHVLANDSVSCRGQIGVRNDKWSGELHLLVYSQLTYGEYSKNELYEKQPYDVRFDHTYQELKAMNFRIVVCDIE